MGDTLRNTVVEVTSTAVQLIAPHPHRTSVLLKPNGGTIYIGGTAAVTTDDGFPLADGEPFSLDDNEDIWAIKEGTGSVEVRVMELF